MKTIVVNTIPKYDVIIRRGGLDMVGECAVKLRGACKALVVSDTNVAPLYLARAIKSLSGQGFEVYDFVFVAGEQSKTPSTYLDIINALATHKFNRADMVVALGGGVVGDIAGFAAATYMRGIDVLQIPTTLLAVIDSSVGGKTGVDLTQGKNLLGAFYQPRLVLCDPDTLSTISPADWSNGLGEAIKYAILSAGRILEVLESADVKEYLEELCAECIELKARIVEKDEKESGERKLLNLGHTLAHAIEKLSEYNVPHGAAVAQGIKYMTIAACKHGELSATESARVLALLNKYELCGDEKFSIDALLECVALDKKSGIHGSLDFIKIKGIGRCEIYHSSIKEFGEYLN